MIYVPDHIKRLRPYVAGKTIEEIVRTYNPPRVSKLASNENRMGCSPDATEAAIESLDRIMNYPDPVALDLRAALAKKLGVKSENIFTASGSEGVMSNIIKHFFEDNDRVVTANATFVGFTVLAHARNLDLVEVPIKDDFSFDLNAIADAVDENTKLIYLANPNNPTGTYFTKPDFESFMNKIPPDCMVIMDEAYFEFASSLSDYPDSLSYRFDNVVTLRTFSKAYGLAGYRIGYAVAHPDLISTLMKTKLTFDPTTPSQAAALAALNDEDFLKDTQAMTKVGKERMYLFFKKQGIRYIPSAANSVMIVLENEEDAIYRTEELMKRGVIVRRLPAFGLPYCIRITVGLPEDMTHLEKAWEEISKQAIEKEKPE